MRMPLSLKGTRASSTILVKTRGGRDSPKGRTLYWYARLSIAKWRNVLYRGRIETWKYVSFRPIAVNQSKGQMHWKMSFCILNVSLWRARFRCPGPRLVVNHRFSWARGSKGCRTQTSSRLEGPALLRPLPVGPWFLLADCRMESYNTTKRRSTGQQPPLMRRNTNT